MSTIPGVTPAIIREASTVERSESISLDAVDAGFQPDQELVRRTRTAYQEAQSAMAALYQWRLDALGEEIEALNMLEANTYCPLVDAIRGIVHNIWPGFVGPSIHERREALTNRTLVLAVLAQSNSEELDERMILGNLVGEELTAFSTYKQAWREYFQARHGYDPIMRRNPLLLR